MAKRAEEPRYIPEAITRDKAFSSYQKDFLRVILKNETYTIAEAAEAVKTAFERRCS